MGSEEETEVKSTSPFAEPDEVGEEGALEVVEGVVETSVPLTPHLSSVSMQQREKEWSAFGEP